MIIEEGLFLDRALSPGKLITGLRIDAAVCSRNSVEVDLQS